MYVVRIEDERAQQDWGEVIYGPFDTLAQAEVWADERAHWPSVVVHLQNPRR